MQLQTIANWTILILLLPAITAYGRIMGSAWNALIRGRYQRARGQASTLNPDAPGGFACVLAFFFANTLLMPLTGLNGAVSSVIRNTDLSQLFVHSDRVLVMERYEGRSLLGEGGSSASA